MLAGIRSFYIVRWGIVSSFFLVVCGADDGVQNNLLRQCISLHPGHRSLHILYGPSQGNLNDNENRYNALQEGQMMEE
jgi:hypothetical protein